MSANTSADYLHQKLSVEFEAFYDKYASALYGEIKRRLHNDDLSQQVMIEACTKISQSFKDFPAGKGKPFIAAFKVVRSEISKTKVNIALNQILYSQMQKQQQISI